MIKIELTDPSEQDARAVVAAMVALHGPEVASRPGRIAASVTVEKPTATSIAAGISSLHKALPDTPAPDGYPENPRDADGREWSKNDDGTWSAKTEAGQLERDEDGVVYVKEPAERDSDGIPWDERIHTSNKSTKQDGCWKRKPGLTDATFDAVMAELRAANTARTMEAAAPLTQPEPSAADAFAPAPAAVPTPPAAAAPVAPTPPLTPAAAPATGSAPSFVQLMQKITAAQQAGKLEKAKLDEALGQCGIEGVAKLVTADDGTRAAFDAVLTAAIG